MKNVGILLFNEVEVLDFAGPYEVFCTASRLEERAGRTAPFKVFTIASQKIIIARGGLKVEADYLLQDSPKIDISLVPGGVVEEPCNNLEILDFIKKVHTTAEITASICTGAFLLAKNGLWTALR
jgi:transcriptional regulator GlxA family with amidase domain